MNITCCDIPSYLNSFPPTWRKELTTLLCQIIGNNSTVSCDAVKSCETLTLVSDLTLDGSNILSFTYYDEQGTANYRSVDLSSLSGGSGSSYVFNNGLTESGGVVKFGGSLLANTSLTTGGFSLNIQSTDGNLLIDNEVIEFDYETIQFTNQNNTVNDSGTFTPSAFYYPDVSGNLRVAPFTYITDLIPTVPVYTSSQGVSKTGTDFKLGDTAVSGTGLSATPFTSHRDITGAFRFSLKNDRVLIGADNSRDNVLSTIPSTVTAGHIKLNVIGKTDSRDDSALSVTNASGKNIINAKNDGSFSIGNHDLDVSTFVRFEPWIASHNVPPYNASVPNDFERDMIWLDSSRISGGSNVRPISIHSNGQIRFENFYSSSADKYIFSVPLGALSTTQIANVQILTNSSITHQSSGYGGTSNIAELQLKHTNSEYATTAIPKQSGLLIDGDYVMPRIYTSGEVNFVNLKPTYNRSSIGGATVGITPLRGFYYAPTIQANAIGVTDEIAYQSTRGSVVIGNGSTKDTLRLPILTTAQRTTVAALTSIGETTNVAKIIYNNDNKFVEHHNGLGWVTQTPETLASGSVTWDACNTNKNLTLNANTSVAITNLVPGSTLVLVATQDVVGARTLTITASGFTIKTAGTLSAVALDTSMVNIYVKSATELLISIVTGYV